MSEKILFVVTNSDPRNACEIMEPIYSATVAANMDYNVELIFSGRAGEIIVKGVAKEISTTKDNEKTIYDLIQDAYKAGVILKASKLLVERWGDDLIAEIEDVVGVGYVISNVMDNSTEVMTY